jgi:hypothetical protein
MLTLFTLFVGNLQRQLQTVRDIVSCNKMQLRYIKDYCQHRRRNKTCICFVTLFVLIVCSCVLFEVTVCYPFSKVRA